MCLLVREVCSSAHSASIKIGGRQRSRSPNAINVPTAFEAGPARLSSLSSIGGEDENRTHLTLLARQHRPLGTCLPGRRASGRCVGRDLNPLPTDYRSVALPNELLICVWAPADCATGEV